MILQSLDKAIRVLNCFKEAPELGVTQISQMLGLNKSNVHNILSTFEEHGFVEQNPQNQRYRLSFGLLELSHSLLNRIGVRNAAYTDMKELAGSTGEHVYLGIPYGKQVLYLEAASPSQYGYERSLSGETAPLYCTSIGKAMLAYLPASQLADRLPEEMHPFTAQTITDPQVLMAELETVRRQGYAIDNMEHEYGIKCVGIPVLDDQGRVLAGLSISGPSLRFDEESIPAYARMLMQLRERIGTVLQSLLTQQP